MADLATFKKHYDKLNPAQRDAVDTIEGPVMVVAGPGTGKTQVLTLRIANILRQTDTPADALLALTFTNAGVHAMRQRLVEMVGSRAYRIPIHTFHSFANEVIRRYPEKFPRIIGATNALPIDQIQILEEAIVECPLDLLRPFGDQFYYLFPVQHEIDRLKRENVSPDRLAEIADAEEAEFKAITDLKHEKGKYAGTIKGKYQTLLTQIQKAKELVILYRAYEERLTARRLYDFGDMLLEVNRALEADANFRLQLQEEYHYILADEHQDANQSQNRMLELLASFHESPNLFIVGDEKQAIFQFQGASLDNFNYFKKLFPTAKLITLTENYRSTQIILDAARSVIGKSTALPPESLVPLKANAPHAPAPVAIRTFTKPEHELLWLVDELKAKAAAGARWNELAVLYRDNAEALPVIDYFERAGVPFVIRSDSNILDDLDLQKILLLFRTVNKFGEDRHLLELLHVDFFDVPILDIYQLAEEARSKKITVWAALGQSRKRPLKQLYRSLERWAKLAANQLFLDLYGVVVKESGFLDHILKLPEATDKLAKLHALYDEVKALTRSNHNFRLADFIQFLNTLSAHHLSIKHRRGSAAEGVELMTAHKSKGLEFDYVYIVNAFDGNWGNKRTANYFKIPTRAGVPTVSDKNDDERRLFYVALTRARQMVTISYAKEAEAGKLNLPSQFIEEIDSRLIETVSSEAWEQDLGDKPNIIFSPRVHQGAKLLDPAYLARRFRDQGISATGLNAYLRCPLDYLFTNLLRVIEIRSKHTMYGTAVHGALEDFFNRYKSGEQVPVEVLLASFNRFIAYQPLGEHDLNASVKRGERALGGWFKTYAHSWPNSILNEYKVSGCHLSPDLKITGKVDKIEFLGGTNIQVVDYKTMQPKSRNEILGQTKSSTGDIYRQLAFYKVLIEECEKERFTVASVMIDFIEPNDKGIYKREVFEVTAGDQASVRETLEKVAGEIVSGEFLGKGCGKPDCPGCRLNAMMK